MTPLTTIESVLTTFGSTDISHDTINLLINDASLQVVLDKFPIDFQELATRYFTCHLMFLQSQQTSSAMQGVTMESVGSLKKQYSAYSGAKGVFNDRWEQLYLTLKQDVQTNGVGSNLAKFI